MDGYSRPVSFSQRYVSPSWILVFQPKPEPFFSMEPLCQILREVDASGFSVVSPVFFSTIHTEYCQASTHP